jgi:hypothetical protein
LKGWRREEGNELKNLDILLFGKTWSGGLLKYDEPVLGIRITSWWDNLDLSNKWYNCSEGYFISSLHRLN